MLIHILDSKGLLPEGHAQVLLVCGSKHAGHMTYEVLAESGS